MKLITAIIRPEKVNEVLEALFAADIHGLTISRAQGHGGETEAVETYRGTTVKMELIDKVKLEIAVSQAFVDRTGDHTDRRPLRTVIHRVGDQVPQRLLDQRPVHDDDQVVRHGTLERHGLRRRPRSEE